MASVQHLTRRPPKTIDARIVARKDWTEELWTIWLRPELEVPFKPGQYVTIGVEGIERPYSVVSAPDEPEIELFIELAPPPLGVLTPRLHRLQPGDRVTMRPFAKGRFTLEPEREHQLMVATVTGIAPYMSIIRDYFRRGGAGLRFYVLHGASYQQDLAYGEELQALAREHPGAIIYVPTVSRPAEERNAGWEGETGRVNTIVERWLGRFGLEPRSTIVYACGHPGMVQDVKARLAPCGWRVKEERYWKD